MKNIYLQITPFFPTNDNFRGPYIYDQVKAIDASSEYEVIVIKLVSFYEKITEEEYIYQGIKVYNFKVWDLPSSVLPDFFHSINMYRLKLLLKKTIGIDMNDIAMIHAHVVYPAGLLAVDLGKEYHISSFIQHHGLDVFQKDNGRILKGQLRLANQNYMKKRYLSAVNAATLNIGVSQKVIEQLYEIEGFTNTNTYVLYNGVDKTKFFKKDKIKNTLFTIGCIGNFWPLKDQMTLLKAVNSIIKEGKNIKVKFVGSGETLDVCKKYVHDESLSKYVDIFKEIDHTELNDFYNSLDLFVLPSYYEALGCVYTEALQVGIPIIAVKGQGIEELIKEEDKGVSLIEKYDYKKLAKQIDFYINAPKCVEYDMNIDNFIKPFLSHIREL